MYALLNVNGFEFLILGYVTSFYDKKFNFILNLLILNVKGVNPYLGLLHKYFHKLLILILYTSES